MDNVTLRQSENGTKGKKGPKGQSNKDTMGQNGKSMKVQRE